MSQATEAWQLRIVRVPAGWYPASPDDRPPADSKPVRKLGEFTTRQRAQFACRDYNRRSSNLGSTLWAVVNVDEEVLDAGAAIDSACLALPEGFCVSGYADRELVGDDRVTCHFNFGVHEVVYFDGLNAEHVVAILRAELERLERALSDALAPKKRNARRALAVA